ncbi:MAG: hypothetical protein ACRDSJ_22190 [Rubrobacteraceae bacterium]
MYGGLTLLERVDLDFTRARRRAFWGSLARRLGFGSGRDVLLDFEETRKKLGAISERKLGRKTVEVSKIVGSVGRSGDFDRDFMPVKARLRKKWEHVDRGFHRGKESRLVSLFKIGDDYYVSDGNHRVSVARFHGVEMIDAEVVEFRPLPNAASNTAARRTMAAEKV